MSAFDAAAIGLRPAEAKGAANNGAASGTGSRQTLGQQDFLTLLVTQLRNQDPLNPLDNEAFVAQLAQFSTVSGITEAAQTLGRMEKLAAGEQRLSAASWIGRTVTGADGQSGQVAAVSFAADGAASLVLADGSSLPLSSVNRLT